ncbi:MAG: DUF4838 domain-containing protein, partial [Oscillospiraceae bacterium]|nr:DUF4838 domain-containing protein [Oscillospiraceae bacterium]
MNIFYEICQSAKSVIAVIISALLALFPGLMPDYNGLPAATEDMSTVPVYEDGTQLLTLAANGLSDYRIVRGENALRVEVTATEELQAYFAQITGVTLPIATDAQPAAEREIVVGKTGRAVDALADRTALGEDGFRITVSGETLLIAGGETRGTLFGVYAFLEDYLGCRWFTPELKVVPALDVAALPADTDVTQIPAFSFRHTSWHKAQDPHWRAQMKFNATMTPVHGTMDESYTDLLIFGGIDAGHTFRFFVPAEQYFESNPEYFALNARGQRMRGQNCLSNPDVFELTKAYIADWIAQYPNAKYLSVSQNDNQDYCRCTQCAAVDAAEGSPAGSLIAFVNKVADYAKTLNPDIFIHTFAYQYTVKPPKNVRPADNVAIQLCSIDNNHSEPYQISAPGFCEDIKIWAGYCPNLIVWDYTTNFGHYLTPFPDLRIMQANVQTFFENGASGYFAQGNSMSLSGEFGELRAYMIGKLLWNPYCDLEKLTDEFLYYYYGPGYQNIKEYIEFAESKRGYSFHIGSKPIVAVLFNP